MTDQYNDMGERECGACKFWLRRTDFAGGMGGGYCVRFPPIFKEERALNDGWPNVHQQSWCGEFKTSTPQPNADEGDGK